MPMPFYIDGKLFFEGISLTQEEFYERLVQDADISTSQPSPGAVLEFWENLLESYDAVVYIPMSSGLSASCHTADMLAREHFPDRVFVVDNQRISVTQRQSVLDALELVRQGKTAGEIKEILEREGLQASIYIAVNTLKYLLKGGRVTPAVAALGTVLKIKPILQIQGERLDTFKKSLGMNQARKIMLDAARSDMEQRFAGKKVYIHAAYTGAPENGKAWQEMVQTAFPDKDVYCAPLSLSVSCHIGAGALAVTCTKKLGE